MLVVDVIEKRSARDIAVCNGEAVWELIFTEGKKQKRQEYLWFGYLHFYEI